MAIFPQGLTQIDPRCTPGERRVLQQLKRCLEDDYLARHPDRAKGAPAGLRCAEPALGVLLLEVKGAHPLCRRAGTDVESCASPA
jgi:hypothetical protein